METFGTLYERVKQLAQLVQDMGKTKKGLSMNAKLIDLGTQAKTIKARMDKYGCSDGCYEFQIQVKEKSGVCSLFKMVLSGLSQSDRTNVLEIISYRLSLLHGDRYELIGITWSKEIKTGILLPA